MAKNVLHFALTPNGIYNEKYYAYMHALLNEHYEFLENLNMLNGYLTLHEWCESDARLDNMRTKCRAFFNNIDNVQREEITGRYLDVIDQYRHFFEDQNSGVSSESLKDSNYSEDSEVIKSILSSKLISYKLGVAYARSQALNWIYELSPKLYKLIVVLSNAQLIDFICEEAR